MASDDDVVSQPAVEEPSFDFVEYSLVDDLECSFVDDLGCSFVRDEDDEDAAATCPLSPSIEYRFPLTSACRSFVIPISDSSFMRANRIEGRGRKRII